MYECDQCGRTTSPGERANSKVIETRPVTYPGGTNGWEIVKEIKVCDSCISIPWKGCSLLPNIKAKVPTTGIAQILGRRTGKIFFVD